MVRNKHNYQFPSGLVNEIEPALRRKTRGERNESRALWFLLGMVAAITLIHFFVEPIIPFPQAHSEELHDNLYYCNQILEGKMRVLGTSMDNVRTYCASI